MFPINTRFAILLAAVMHAAGLIGIGLGWGELFSILTPFNMLTMIGLLIATTPERSRYFWFFLIGCALTGLITEIIGVNTALLFGHYSYGEAFGTKLFGVPLLIGFNWFLVVYASGTIAVQIRKKINLPIAFTGAWIATIFDYIMEPAAVKQGFWTWEGGQIPLLNYMSWFGISFLLLLFFKESRLKAHPFAVFLLMIQALFFLCLRAFF